MRSFVGIRKTLGGLGVMEYLLGRESMWRLGDGSIL